MRKLALSAVVFAAAITAFPVCRVSALESKPGVWNSPPRPVLVGNPFTHCADLFAKKRFNAVAMASSQLKNAIWEGEAPDSGKIDNLIAVLNAQIALLNAELGNDEQCKQFTEDIAAGQQQVNELVPSWRSLHGKLFCKDTPLNTEDEVENPDVRCVILNKIAHAAELIQFNAVYGETGELPKGSLP